MPYPFDTETDDALVRLDTFYNGENYDAGTNAGGMGNGGHRVNFIDALTDLATVGQSVSDAADSASTSAGAASASAADAATSADKLAGTSTTSVSIGTGSKTFTTQAGKSFAVGSFVVIVSAANPTTHYMGGQVTAYATTTLTVNVTVSLGSGTRADWSIYVAGSPGAIGNTGNTGATGATPALQWQWGNGTADSDPGNGILLFNNATFASITQLFIDNVDALGTTQTTFLDALDDSTNTANRGSIFIQQISDPTIYARFTVSGVVTDGTGYRKVAVTPDVARGTFVNGATVALAFSRTGNAGLDGAGAGDVISDISSVTDGRIVIFNGTGGKHVTNANVGIGTSGANLGALNTANTYSLTQSFTLAPLPTTSDGAALGSATFQWSDAFFAAGAVLNFNNGDVTVTHGSNVLTFAGAASGYSFDADILPVTSDGGALGSATKMFSDLFLASGAVINLANGDVTITHSTNLLAFAGSTGGYTFDAVVKPATNDGAALGTSAVMFSDLFLASGAVINFNASAVTITHATNQLNFQGATVGYYFQNGPVGPLTSDGSSLGTTANQWSDLWLASGGVINWNNSNVTLTHTADSLNIVASNFTLNGFPIQIPPMPCGRLTLTTGTPVMSSDVAGATTVYYTPTGLGGGHRFVPLFDATLSKYYPFGIGAELSQTTTDTTKSPAAVANNSNYDMFVWTDGGTARCTRGPAWTSDTGRGTGAGTTELELLQGVYVNKNAITNGPGARLGTYVGTIRSNGSAAIDWKMGTSAAGGGEARLCVWNAYHRKHAKAVVTDSTVSWTYASATARSANNSATNRVSFIQGLQEDAVDVSGLCRITTPGTGVAVAYLGMALDATNALDKRAGVLGSSIVVGVGVTPRNLYAPQIGFHFIQLTEQGDGTNTMTFIGANEEGLFVTLPM